MQENKKKISTVGLARLIAIAGKQKEEGTYEIVEGTRFVVRGENVTIHIDELVYLECDRMNIRVDEELGEVLVHLRLKEEHIGFCRFWL